MLKKLIFCCLAIMFIMPVCLAERVTPRQMSDRILNTEWGKSLPQNQDLSKIVSSVPYLGNYDYWYNYKDGSIPIRLAKYTDTGYSLHIVNLLPDSVYNSLKFSPREATADSISNYIIPYATRLLPYAQACKVDTVIIGSHLRYKDLSNEYNPIIENSFFVAFPLNQLSLYAEGKIADQELINSSNVQLDSWDGNGFRRISITLK